MPNDAMKTAMTALIDADHLAECAEKLLAALNKKAGAQERVEVADMPETNRLATIELEQAEEEVSEYWRAVRSATYEYRKRAERARQAIESNPK